MQVVNFFKSFVSPIRMVKYRYMSVLISLCIFILASYLLAIPRCVYLSKNVDKLITEDNYYYLHCLTELPGHDDAINAELEKIQSLELKVDEVGKLSSDKLVDAEGKKTNFYQTELSYVNDKGRTVKITIVFDLFEKEADMKYDYSKEFTYNEELFPDIENVEYYLVLFRTDKVIYIGNPLMISEANVKRDEVLLTNLSCLSMNSSSYYTPSKMGSDGETFGKYMASIIGFGFVQTENSSYSIFVFIFCAFFPLILIFVFWLCCRKTGRLKTFKEYYNIGAICSVLPILASFIFSWISPLSDMLFTVFIMSFCLYYLYMLYKINSTMEIV